MTLWEQSGEPRLSLEPDQSGSSSGEPPEPELCHGTFFDAESARLPLTDREVGDICESRPHSIRLSYASLDFEEPPPKAVLPTTIEVIQAQERWEADILNWFRTRGYDVADRRALSATPYCLCWRGLETLMSMYYTENFPWLRAFQARMELQAAQVTPELCPRELVFEPSEAPEKPVSGSFRPRPLAATSPPASALGKRRRSDAFPLDETVTQVKSFRSNTWDTRVKPGRTAATRSATRSRTYVRPMA